MKKTLLASFGLLLVLTGSALARDSAHYVCTGFIGEKSDKYGIAIQFDEHRGHDGASRDEMLSAVWAGTLYQGIRNNQNDDFGQNGKIAMIDSAKETFFKGKYNLVSKVKSDGDSAWDLQLDGIFDLSPDGSESTPVKTSVLLSCIDIST
jgi:hypothetical protein